MRKKSYSRPVSDISGYRTFVTETSAKNLPASTAKPSKNNLRYETPENKERALPASESEAENKIRYIGQPSFSKPDETNDTVVNPRTLGKPGEDYGHPVIGPTRHPGRRPIQAKFKYFPKKNQRQHKQKRKARIYSRRWYRRRKSKHKRMNRLNYKHKKRNPQFKRKKRFYNSAKYNAKHKRLPYGGVRTQAERSKNWRKKNASTDPMGSLVSMMKTSNVENFADQVRKEIGLQTFHVVERGDDIHLLNFEVHKENRKQGLGTQAMQRLVNYADTHNKRIILSPAQKGDYGGTTSRSRLVMLYKQFGFVENKGRNRDFSLGAGEMFRDPKRKISARQKARTPQDYKKSRDYYRKNKKKIQRKSKQYRKKNKQKMKLYRKKYKQNPNQYKRQGQSRYRRIQKTASSLFVFGMNLPVGFRFGFVKEILLKNWSVILHIQEFGKQILDINSFLNHAIFCDNSEARFFALLEKGLEHEE